MTDVEVTLTLPKDLVDEASTAGLLTEEKLAALLEKELERLRRVDHFFELMDKLHALEPTLKPSLEEIEAEVRAVKDEDNAKIWAERDAKKHDAT